MKVIEIESLEVPEVAVYAHLTEAQLRSRLEPEQGVFIVESEKVIRVALAAGMRPLSFLAERKFVERQVRGMCEEYGLEVPVYTAEREVLAGLTGYALTRGVLCAMRRPGEVSVDTLLSQRQAATREGSARNATGIPLPNLGEQPDSNVQRQAVYGKGRRRIVVLDGVVNSENTGAIFRAAAALGMDAVLLTRTCCDPLNRRACRVSMGTVFQVPWTWIEGGERDEVGGKSYPQVLRELGFKSVAMALTDRSVPIDDPVLREPERLAIIMGTEGDGLSAEVLEACDYVARIPMQHGVDSLNVAAAAAVAFWELG